MSKVVTNSAGWERFTIAILLQTCKLNNVDSMAWLAQTLERIANQWPSAKIDDLMPWN